jgi:predicted ester cyclase
MSAATVARRWMNEIWNEKRADTIDELLHVDAIGHMETGTVRGREQFKVIREQILKTFPDVTIVIDEVLEGGESVVVRFHGEALHATGDLGIPPTNQRFPLSGMLWLHVRDGQIVEGWDNWNLSAISAASQQVQQHMDGQLRAHSLA